MLTTLDQTLVHTTPNATMRRYPGTAVAVWRTEMAPAASGPRHSVDVEQVVVVLEGSVEVRHSDGSYSLAAGDSVLLPAGSERQVVAGAGGSVTLTAALPGGVAQVDGGDPIPVRWAA